MIINFTQPELVSFFAKVIAWLVQICGSIALGIVLFTVLLKVITLPFDFFSRASMRKNNVKMEQMRPELEKLQKQYADNKDLYNQKMMALYKKNGYSMFGSCLPTILTLVIFIIALNGFTDYSQYKNKEYFYNMSCSYNNVIYAGFELDEDYINRDESGKISFDSNKLYSSFTSSENTATVNAGTEEKPFKIFLSREKISNGGNMTVYTENGYSKAIIPYDIKEDGQADFTGKLINYDIIEGKVAEFSKKDAVSPILSEENNLLKIKKDGKELFFAESGLSEKDFIRDIQQEKSAETFREENSSFLWVKNIWVTDSPLKHPVESSWDTFNTTHEYQKDQPQANNIGKDGYNNLIAKLDYEKEAPNGFFILVLLTAGSSLLVQLVMGKSQKAQMELQTVDGQGAQTQKMMMWMMPIMMAIFAFMYTAAFSIYIILSSLMSMGLTFAINAIVDRTIKKQEDSKPTQKIRGRVYTPKEEEQKKEKEPENKKKKDDKFSHEAGGDFLTGPVKKKNVKYKK